MDTRDLHDKGLKLRREMFGRDAVEQRMNALGAFGEPLQNMINAYAYGDIWSRPALPLKTKSLAAIAMTAAICQRASRPCQRRTRQRLHGGRDSRHSAAGRPLLRDSGGDRGPSRRARRAARTRSGMSRVRRRHAKCRKCYACSGQAHRTKFR
jgi:hypothetical protein